MRKKTVKKISAEGTISFSEFLSEPPISATLLVIGLVTLFLAIVNFSQAIGY